MLKGLVLSDKMINSLTKLVGRDKQQSRWHVSSWDPANELAALPCDECLRIAARLPTLTACSFGSSTEEVLWMSLPFYPEGVHVETHASPPSLPAFSSHPLHWTPSSSISPELTVPSQLLNLSICGVSTLWQKHTAAVKTIQTIMLTFSSLC